ncbi:DNA excision repair protein ERCC-5 homolog [Pelodytes ibericus]
MGVQGLWKLLECSGRPINLDTLEGKILAVDISIWLNQAVKGARDRHGNAIENAHLLTLFHRLCKLLFFRIRPVFVFDGEAPLLKRQTLAKRRQRKDVAANEAKKTNDKLLRTFLKRQAIKAALTGNNKSTEQLPSLSQVRRKEEEDLYVLPPLEDKDKHSSEEEEEQEWEERMSQKQILQEEFFADPRSVNIESEDFKSLPPEVKHEILTDMKEFTKRRRTLFETMPEDSSDFSKYQLRGLLKKNNLNKCIQNVRNEMSQQYSGEIQAQFETEGGFMKEVETRRLVSEDTSHYILIKGIQKKTEDKKENLSVESVSSVPMATAPKTYLDLKLAAAHKPKQLTDISVDAAPPSPRTLFAIEEAMVEDNSDMELDAGLRHSAKTPESVSGEGSISPRTLKAIQQALDEDEPGESIQKDVDKYSKPEEIETQAAKALDVSSSDEENDGVVIVHERRAPPLISVRHIEHSPSPTQFIKSTMQVPKKGEPSSAFKTLKVDSLQPQSAKKFLFFDKDNPVASSSSSRSIGSVSDLKESSLGAPTPKSNTAATNEDLSVVVPAAKEASMSNDFVEVLSNKREPPLEPSISVHGRDIPPVLSGPLRQDASLGLAAPLLPQILNENRGDDGQNMAASRSNNPDSMYLPLTPESIEAGEEENARDNDEESDSDVSFIFVDVDSDAGDGNLQLDETKATNEEPTTKLAESSPTNNDRSAGSSVGVSFTADDVEESMSPPQRDTEDVDTSVNEWQDISVEELESLENNLFIEQSSLQAQKQQQERIAATVTDQMCIESQELLRLFGIPFIVAPMEAEAQCAILDLTDQTSGTITDDSDIWLFGARHVYKNFFTQNKYVEYYQFSDIQNQLGLDRSKLINLAYLMGSDYTEGIASIGFVSAMEILNEFPGKGLESLLKFKEWWTDAQKTKKIRPNPNDTKVKKKLRELQLHPCFPNKAVAEAYLKPVVDDSKGAFSWGRPDLDQIREFCANRFGWYRSKTDELLLPVLKQLNAQKTQLRIDSFFRIEQNEARGLKSQRLRRAVTCLKRKEKDGEAEDVEEATALMENEFAAKEDEKDGSLQTEDAKCLVGKRKRARKPKPEESDIPCAEGGFIGSSGSVLSPNKPSPEESDSDGKDTCTKVFKESKTGEDVLRSMEAGCLRSSSSSDDEDKTVLVTARPLFQGNQRKPKITKGRKK